MSDLQAYLQILAPHSVLAKFVLEHGRSYEPQPLTTEERALVERCAGFHGGIDEFLPRECFYNAQMLAMYDATKQLRYVEGYALRMIPVLHGWASLNGKLIDVTWRHEDGTPILGDCFTGEYRGIEIPTSYVKHIHFRDRKGKSLLADEKNGFPLLRKPRSCST